MNVIGMKEILERALSSSGVRHGTGEAEAPEAPYEIDPELADPEYREILKLDRLLKEQHIPHRLKKVGDGYVLFYPNRPNRYNEYDIIFAEIGGTPESEQERITAKRRTESPFYLHGMRAEDAASIAKNAYLDSLLGGYYPGVKKNPLREIDWEKWLTPVLFSIGGVCFLLSVMLLSTIL